MGSEDTKLALMRAAEKLFAEKGLNAISMREISLAAGQANPSAAGYHFSSKIGIIDAILARHCMPIQDEWITFLDSHSPDAITVRDLIRVMLVPIIEKLDDPDGGVEYISICAQLCSHPIWPLIYRPISRGEGALRLGGALMQRAGLPHDVITLRMQRSASVMYNSICEYYRMGGVVSREIFVSDLIDTMEALCTFVSDETVEIAGRFQSSISESSSVDERPD